MSQYNSGDCLVYFDPENPYELIQCVNERCRSCIGKDFQYLEQLVMKELKALSADKFKILDIIAQLPHPEKGRTISSMINLFQTTDLSRYDIVINQNPQDSTLSLEKIPKFLNSYNGYQSLKKKQVSSNYGASSSQQQQEKTSYTKGNIKKIQSSQISKLTSQRPQKQSINSNNITEQNVTRSVQNMEQQTELVQNEKKQQEKQLLSQQEIPQLEKEQSLQQQIEEHLSIKEQLEQNTKFLKQLQEERLAMEKQLEIQKKINNNDQQNNNSTKQEQQQQQPPQKLIENEVPEIQNQYQSIKKMSDNESIDINSSKQKSPSSHQSNLSSDSKKEVENNRQQQDIDKFRLEQQQQEEFERQLLQQHAQYQQIDPSNEMEISRIEEMMLQEALRQSEMGLTLEIENFDFQKYQENKQEELIDLILRSYKSQQQQQKKSTQDEQQKQQQNELDLQKDESMQSNEKENNNNSSSQNNSQQQQQEQEQEQNINKKNDDSFSVEQRKQLMGQMVQEIEENLDEGKVRIKFTEQKYTEGIVKILEQIDFQGQKLQLKIV